MFLRRSKQVLLAIGAITLATTITCRPDLSALDGTTIIIDRDRDRDHWHWDDDDDWGFDFDWWWYDRDCCW